MEILGRLKAVLFLLPPHPAIDLSHPGIRKGSSPSDSHFPILWELAGRCSLPPGLDWSRSHASFMELHKRSHNAWKGSRRVFLSRDLAVAVAAGAYGSNRWGSWLAPIRQFVEEEATHRWLGSLLEGESMSNCPNITYFVFLIFSLEIKCKFSLT